MQMVDRAGEVSNTKGDMELGGAAAAFATLGDVYTFYTMFVLLTRYLMASPRAIASHVLGFAQPDISIDT